MRGCIIRYFPPPPPGAHRYTELAVLVFGVLGAGSSTVRQASLDDAFGAR